MRPWEHPVPAVLYKYFPPDRLHILTDCKVRFSQRVVFDDAHELQPEYLKFGTADEIRRYMKLDTGFKMDPRLPPDKFVEIFANSPELQLRARTIAQRSMKSPGEFGVFCLTDSSNSARMWRDYAAAGQGFIVAFDTAHPGFEMLKSPGRLGRVDYSDIPFGTFLGTFLTEGAGVFFRKRMKYAFEREWRSIRGLHRLEHSGRDVYLSPFDSACVKKIIIRPSCRVEGKLRHFLAIDARYRHVALVLQD